MVKGIFSLGPDNQIGQIKKAQSQGEELGQAVPLLSDHLNGGKEKACQKKQRKEKEENKQEDCQVKIDLAEKIGGLPDSQIAQKHGQGQEGHEEVKGQEEAPPFLLVLIDKKQGCHKGEGKEDENQSILHSRNTIAEFKGAVPRPCQPLIQPP